MALRVFVCSMCPICLEEKCPMMALPCGHTLCRECLGKVLKWVETKDEDSFDEDSSPFLPSESRAHAISLEVAEYGQALDDDSMESVEYSSEVEFCGEVVWEDDLSASVVVLDSESDSDSDSDSDSYEVYSSCAYHECWVEDSDEDEASDYWDSDDIDVGECDDEDIEFTEEESSISFAASVSSCSDDDRQSRVGPTIVQIPWCTEQLPCTWGAIHAQGTWIIYRQLGAMFLRHVTWKENRELYQFSSNSKFYLDGIGGVFVQSEQALSHVTPSEQRIVIKRTQRLNPKISPDGIGGAWILDQAPICAIGSTQGGPKRCEVLSHITPSNLANPFRCVIGQSQSLNAHGARVHDFGHYPRISKLQGDGNGGVWIQRPPINAERIAAWRLRHISVERAVKNKPHFNCPANAFIYPDGSEGVWFFSKETGVISHIDAWGRQNAWYNHPKSSRVVADGGGGLWLHRLQSAEKKWKLWHLRVEKQEELHFCPKKSRIASDENGGLWVLKPENLNDSCNVLYHVSDSHFIKVHSSLAPNAFFPRMHHY